MDNPKYWAQRALENLQTSQSLWPGNSAEIHRLLKQSITLLLMAVAHGEEGS